ncbi:MAG: hypothetical protein K0R59_1696 [Sphingobacterium sp.]|jgi:hypothetical protein|nr:hypothetical protein [Sphingobacterium sp.]
MKKYFSIYSMALVLGMSSITAISCSEKENKEDLQVNKGNIAIRSVRFVNDENVINVGGTVKKGTAATSQQDAAALEASMTFESKVVSPLNIQSAADFDFATDMQTNALGEPENSLKASTNSNKPRAADIPLNQNKKFRLIFIKDGASTPVYNGLLNAGQDPNLTVEANAKYKWYAISVNDPSTAPDIDGNGNIAGADLANKDFMFASGEMTTQPENNYLDILFLRQMAAIEVKINTRGIFGGITDNSTFSVGKGTGTAFTNIIQTGDFSIFNASFSNLQDVGPVNGSEMTVVDSRWGNAEKIAHFYTANTSSISANNLRVRLDGLHITLDDNSTRNFAANSIVPISHGSTLNLTKGTLSKTNVRLIESGVSVSGLVWARTNLVYDSEKLYGGSYTQGASDAYRFRTDNNYSYPSINTEYWNFGTTTPRGTDYRTVDQCKRVYPELTWRSPLESDPQEYTRLRNNTNRKTSITRVPDGYRHTITWTGTQAHNSAYPDNDLVLSYYGYIDNNGNRQQIPSGSSAGTGTLRYKSASFNTSNNGNRILYAEVSNGTFQNMSIQEVAFSQGNTIRCVRNVINN